MNDKIARQIAAFAPHRLPSQDVPRFNIVAGNAKTDAGLTLFEVILIAGDEDGARLGLFAGGNHEHPSVGLEAVAGAQASFSPAAPARLMDRLQLAIDGTDAVAMILYR